MLSPLGLFVLNADAYGLAYGPDEREAIEQLATLIGPPMTRDDLAARSDLLARVEVLFSGWGAPLADDAFLDQAPRLRTVFYAAGATGSWMTEAAWDRGLVVTTASAANAVPVAEYTLATILFSLKHGWKLAREARVGRFFPPRDAAPGSYRSTVGLISLGLIARTLLDLLKPFDLDVVVYDPFLGEAEANALGVTRVSLDALFRRADVVSVHAPELPETQGMVTGRHVESMKFGGTFINTARGPIVREAEVLEVLARRPDLQAVLDTVTEEPPPAGSPLYTLPNVLLTPHIAGSVGNECRRMGRYMVDELERYVRGEPLRWALTREATRNSAHRPRIDGRRPKRSAQVAATA
jgi:phosphoglycerate dehydrogenase-like enzyme